MEEQEARNGSTSGFDGDDEYVNIHFLIGDRREVACFRPDQVSNIEIKELFRSAAEAGPLDIVKLRKGDKILNISPHLPANAPDDPYILQVVGGHPASTGMLEADLLRALERRVAALERELQEHQEAASAAPCLALRELKRQVDAFKKKLETAEHLSWLGFYKQLPEPISSEACRRLQYRRKSDSVKRKVRERFLSICDVAVSQTVRELLRSPAFDARQWEDEELLLMLQTMFVELELPQKFSIPLSTLRNFIYEVYKNYNEVPFHNFRHCFCVAQMAGKLTKNIECYHGDKMYHPRSGLGAERQLREMKAKMENDPFCALMYAMVWAVDLASKIGDLEVLVLIVSCICHDLDHPGYNNIYQINARTELALRYNDISPLENHHCSVAFRVLEAPECNILASLDSPTYRIVREGIIRCILATDMARHNEILAQFTDVVPDFDFTSKAHINLLSMVMIKVADISNEARPMDVAEPWLDSLLQEFFKQSDAEKLEGLPVTPFMDRDKVTKPSSQCSFIGLVLLPLFEALGELFNELQELIVEPVHYALEYYRRLNEAAKDERHQRKSVVDVGEQAAHGVSGPSGSSSLSGSGSGGAHGSAGHSGSGDPPSCVVVKSTSAQSVRSKRSMGTLHSRSRSIEDDGADYLVVGESGDPESSDPETATEVEVSEKTLKFKISTEGNISTSTPGRKSYPGSRKGSREKSSLDYHNHDLAKAVREHERERRRSRGENLSSDVSSPVSARSNDEARIAVELEREELQLQRVAMLMLAEDGRPDGNGRLILDTAQQRRNNRINKRTASVDSSEREVRTTDDKDIVQDVVRCCCDDKTGSINHKSLLSRLRNLTDRLTISFESKETPIPKNSKCFTAKNTHKSLSINNSTLGGKVNTSSFSARHNNSVTVCKKCNLSKINNKELRDPDARIAEQLSENAVEKRSMTLPKMRRSQDCKNRSWRTVFAKEKRPSISLETLPAGGSSLVDAENATTSKHRRNLSNPEGKSRAECSSPKSDNPVTEQQQKINFKEIDVRPSKPEIFVDQVNSGSSSAIDDIGKVEIRRSSASMEDISKITKQSEAGLLGCSLEQQKSEECQQHTGSLDSMLCQDKSGALACKGPAVQYGGVTSASIGGQAKKSSPGLFSRFKSGMSIDGTRSSSNSGSLHEQQTAGWISSLTASFRPRRQGEAATQAQALVQHQQQQSSPKLLDREEVK